MAELTIGYRSWPTHRGRRGTGAGGAYGEVRGRQAMSGARERPANSGPRAPVRGPELYRENLFRITGLPVDATPRIIRRQRKEFEMAALVDDPPPTTKGRFALDPAPDASAAQAAFEGFRDLERRLVDELFWFWRTEPPDAGLNATGSVGASDLDVEHDRAVAAHCTALDLEHLGRRRALTAAERNLRDDSWAQAIPSWAALIEEPRMWDRLHARIVAIDDPRLTTATLDDLLDDLPVRLLTIHAQLALDTALRNLQDAGRQRRLMDRFISEARLDTDAVDTALRDVVAPTVRRIEAGCEATRSAAVEDPATACTVGARMFTELQPALRAIDVILTATHPTARAVRDQVAGALNVCAVQHSNAAGTDRRALAGLEAAVRLLMEAQQLANLVTTKNLINDNLHGIREQVRALTPVSRFQRDASPQSTPPRAWPAAGGQVEDDVRTGQEIVAGLRRMGRGPWSYVDQLCREGRPDLAHDALALWANFMAKNTEITRQVVTLLAKPAPFVATMKRRPKRSMVLGCGIDFRGRHHLSADEFVVRQYLILFLVPLIPIAAYLIKAKAGDVPRFAGKVPLGMPLRYWRKFLTALFVIMLVILAYDGSAVFSALGIAVALRIGFQIYKALTLREKIRLATKR